jgi:hypothetical protein
MSGAGFTLLEFFYRKLKNSMMLLTQKHSIEFCTVSDEISINFHNITIPSNVFAIVLLIFVTHARKQVGKKTFLSTLRTLTRVIEDSLRAAAGFSPLLFLSSI